MRRISNVNWNVALTLILAIATIWLAVETRRLVTNTVSNFEQLNRPYISLGQNLQPLNENDRTSQITNIGLTSAKNVTFTASYIDKSGKKQILITDNNPINVGVLYPGETRGVILKNPDKFVADMLNNTITMEIEYQYASWCIKYEYAITAQSDNNLRLNPPQEQKSKCNT